MTPQETNEKSLNRLIRAIRLSSGEFSLILAFANMNQLRKEFRGLPFPVVLWGNDPALERFARVAPDFRTWAGSATRFESEEPELLEALRHNAEPLIASAMGTDKSGPKRFG